MVSRRSLRRNKGKAQAGGEPGGEADNVAPSRSDDAGQALTDKYRPRTFEEVVGHKTETEAIASAIKRGTNKAFLFTGPAGVGKTTLARIAAAAAGVQRGDLIEVDAATNTGIDDMRAVAAPLMYKPLSGGKTGIIIDEVHALSKAAVQSLLKITEEPPAHVYWFFCTTEAGRVLPTLKTRCFAIDLKPLSTKRITNHLWEIAGKEKMECVDEIIGMCAEYAQGSMRQAIANLAVCAEARTTKNARRLLGAAINKAEAVELARFLVNGSPWKVVRPLLERLNDNNAESVRYVVRAYVGKVALGSEKEAVAGRMGEILDAFDNPFHDSAALALACMKVLLS